MSHTEIGILVHAKTQDEATSAADRQVEHMLDEIGDWYDFTPVRVIRASDDAFRTEMAKIARTRRQYLHSRLDYLRCGSGSLADKRRWKIQALNCVSGEPVYGNTYYYSTLSYTGCVTNRELKKVKRAPKKHWLVIIDYHN